MKQEIKTVIDTHIKDAMTNENAAAQFMVDLCMIIMDTAYDTVMQNQYQSYLNENHQVIMEKTQEYINDSMMEAHKIWLEAAHYINQEYHIIEDSSTFLMIMTVYANPDNLPITEIEDPYMRLICRAVIAALQKLGTDVFDPVIKESISKTIEHENRKMEHAVEHTDPGMLKTFFKLFKELGDFHRDINQYSSEEDKKKYLEMLDIYQHMLSTLD